MYDAQEDFYFYELGSLIRDIYREPNEAVRIQKIRALIASESAKKPFLNPRQLAEGYDAVMVCLN